MNQKSKGKISEIENEIAEYEELIKDASVPMDEKDFAKDEIKLLKAELELQKQYFNKLKVKKTPPATTKAPKQTPAKKTAKDALPSCDELQEAWEKRKAAAVKANKKHKTVSISEKIGTDVAHAVKKIVNNIPAADIKDNPEKYIEKFKKVETATSEFLNSLKSLLGDDFDKKELLEPFEEIIGKFIENVKKKYTK